MLSEDEPPCIYCDSPNNCFQTLIQFGASRLHPAALRGDMKT